MTCACRCADCGDAVTDYVGRNAPPGALSAYVGAEDRTLCRDCYRIERGWWRCGDCGAMVLRPTGGPRARHDASRDHKRQVELTARARDGWVPVANHWVARARAAHLRLEEGSSPSGIPKFHIWFARTEEAASLLCDHPSDGTTGKTLACLLAAARMVAAHGVPWRRAWAQARADARHEPEGLGYLSGAGPGDRWPAALDAASNARRA